MQAEEHEGGGGDAGEGDTDDDAPQGVVGVGGVARRPTAGFSDLGLEAIVEDRRRGRFAR